MQLELISFKLCPFVQRSIITLLYKQQPYEITYIDINQPPEWFKTLSPLGKVPLLKVDGQVLFESAVINEYINDVTPGNLMPEDPLQRAINRAWIEFGGQCLGQLNQLITAADADEFGQAHDKAMASLGKLEQVLGNGPFFNGNDFALIDAAFAPLLMRYALLNRLQTVLAQTQLPKVHAWMAQLTAMDVVKNSVVNDFETLFRQRISRANGHLAGLLSA